MHSNLHNSFSTYTSYKIGITMHRRFFRKNFSTFILKMMTFVKNLKIYQGEASLNLFYRVYLDVITTDNTVKR